MELSECIADGIKEPRTQPRQTPREIIIPRKKGHSIRLVLKNYEEKQSRQYSAQQKPGRNILPSECYVG